MDLYMAARKTNNSPLSPVHSLTDGKRDIVKKRERVGGKLTELLNPSWFSLYFLSKWLHVKGSLKGETCKKIGKFSNS